jgi:dihydrofolate reductase
MHMATHPLPRGGTDFFKFSETFLWQCRIPRLTYDYHMEVKDSYAIIGGDMSKLMVFNNVSLDGFFTDANGDMSWAHNNDPEWQEFTAQNAQGSGGGTLLFGRVTYEMMASFWPTPQAMQIMPDVATAMNSLQKVVFSRTMEKADWQNTRLVKSGLVEEVKRMKKDDGAAIVIMGSGTIVSQLSEHRLIDEYQIVVHPIVLGKGRTLFEGVSEKMNLKRTDSRTFGNGNVVLTYVSA